jgi:hypothetical protein
MNINRDNSSLTILTPLIYFVTLFYSFGVLLMTYFVGFPTFDRIHENVEAAMTIFSHRMIVISTIPMFLNAIFGVMLLKFNDRYFPRIVIWISILLCSVSLISNLLLISSYSDLHTTGFTGEAKSWIIFMSANFQIIPLIIQIFLAFWLLNNHLQDTMWFGRWLFILLFSFTFFALGTDFVEKYVNYPIWATVGEKDWIEFRHATVSQAFIGVYLLPAILPLLFVLPMFWRRPLGVSKLLMTIFILIMIWVSVITGNYFMPKLQAPLWSAYSKPLIEELMRNDLPLRVLPLLIMQTITAIMFFKIGLNKIDRT